MSRAFSTVVLLSCTVVTGSHVFGQSDAKVTPPAGMTTLSGCVTPTPNSKKSFTLEGAEPGQVYRLTGTDVREYVGRHVEILGAPSKKLVIVGGLYPSATVAGQAGAIDPAKAAIASQSGPTSNQQRPVIEFKVRSVRITPGDCPKE